MGTLTEHVNNKLSSEVVALVPSTKEILYQITSGLEYLHSEKNVGLKEEAKGIIHRDMKPDNILIFRPSGSNDGRPALIKISDFGQSRESGTTENPTHNLGLLADRTPIPTANGQQNRTVVNHGYSSTIAPFGTDGWRAPEYYSGVPYTSKIDLFPLGCIFVFVLSKGKHPFSEKLVSEWDKDELVKIINQIKQPSTPILNADEFEETAFNLIKIMLNYKPKERPTASQVKNDPYFLQCDSTFPITVFTPISNNNI